MQTRDAGRNNVFAARSLRQRPAAGEDVLWKHLRNRALAGLKFRRQHPIGRFVLDFYCAEAGVAIEIDGGVHAGPERKLRDAERQALLEARGIRFLRFTSSEVESDVEAVLKTIKITCTSTPSPRARGEGARG